MHGHEGSGGDREVSYPRQKARTRSFQCGRPRSFAIAGTRLLFIRSSHGTDPAGSLWLIDLAAPEPAERCVVDVTALPVQDDAELPAAERARRERMREVTAGITAFSADRDGTRVAFCVQGTPYLVDLREPAGADPGSADKASAAPDGAPATRVRPLPSPGPVVDPRIDPTGARVAMVVEGALHVIDLATGDVTEACPVTAEHQTWGLADFIAAEELDRYRGHWWIDDGAALLVEEVDESGVDVRWIADPTEPSREPVAHRYPSAGTANARVRLWRVDPEGNREPLDWDQAAYPYLASVHPSRAGVTVQVMSRDQRQASILALDPGARELRPLREASDPNWLDVMPGVPVRDDSGAVIDILADHETDTFRILRDGTSLTPAGLQVRGLLDATPEHLVFLASPDPTVQVPYRLDLATGGLQPLAAADGWASAVAQGSTIVLATADADTTVTGFTAEFESTARGGTGRIQIPSHAERPAIEIAPRITRVGERELATCLLLPRDHRPGQPLPVLMSPYGGPHAQRVVRSAAAYATDQWLADQGFAVVIADGRGTPGRGPVFERAIAGDLAAVVLQDQVDALLGLAAVHPELDLTRVGIRGWSFGGYLAALAVLDRPDVFHAAVAGAPVTEWRLYDTAYTERYLGDPRQDPERYDRESLLPRAHQLTRPLLMLHGLADDNVLAANTLQLSGALLAAGRPHAVVPLSGVTHMTPQEVVAENLLRLEVDFFATSLAR